MQCSRESNLMQIIDASMHCNTKNNCISEHAMQHMYASMHAMQVCILCKYASMQVCNAAQKTNFQVCKALLMWLQGKVEWKKQSACSHQQSAAGALQIRENAASVTSGPPSINSMLFFTKLFEYWTIRLTDQFVN